jgi:PAS domain-containing protein
MQEIEFENGSKIVVVEDDEGVSARGHRANQPVFGYRPEDIVQANWSSLQGKVQEKMRWALREIHRVPNNPSEKKKVNKKKQKRKASSASRKRNR